MLLRIIVLAILSGLLTVGALSGAHAQQPISAGQPGTIVPGWTFNVAPYLWMPRLNVTSAFDLPPALGGTVSSDSTVGFANLVSHLNFGVMTAADARYGRFSILTDLFTWTSAALPFSSNQSTFRANRRSRSRPACGPAKA